MHVLGRRNLKPKPGLPFPAVPFAPKDVATIRPFIGPALVGKPQPTPNADSVGWPGRFSGAIRLPLASRFGQTLEIQLCSAVGRPAALQFTWGWALQSPWADCIPRLELPFGGDRWETT